MRFTGPRKGSGLLKIAVLIMGLLVLGAGGFLAWDRLHPTEADTGDENVQEAEEDQIQTETVALGEFLVNLRTADGALRYLQTEISLVVVPPEDERAGGHEEGHDSGGEELVLPPASQRYARDVAIEVLSSQSFEKLRDSPDRSGLKALLQQKLDAALDTWEVRDVLFTAFVMQ